MPGDTRCTYTVQSKLLKNPKKIYFHSEERRCPSGTDVNEPFALGSERIVRIVISDSVPNKISPEEAADYDHGQAVRLPRGLVSRNIVLSRYEIVSSLRPRGPLSYITAGPKSSRDARYACAYHEIIPQSSNLLHLNRGVETEHVIIVYIPGQG